MSSIILFFIVSFIVLVIVWLAVGYLNYSRFLNVMAVYEEEYKKHEKLETLSQSVELKTNHFLKKETLINEYGGLHRAYLTKEEEGEKFYKNARNSFLRYGFLYNFL